jgi:recombinational DNA repair ATPase RecF
MTTFRIQKLTLEQFRRFEKLELPLEDDLTLLFAENGGGKTAILHGARRRAHAVSDRRAARA